MSFVVDANSSTSGVVRRRAADLTTQSVQGMRMHDPEHQIPAIRPCMS